jgi:RNA polymerase sigma factor (sigma-70 family)
MKPPNAVFADWGGLDLAWVYSELLAGIRRRTQSLHHAYDVLHEALIRFALANGRQTLQQPHAYLRTVVGSVLVDHHHESQRFVALAEDGDAPAALAARPSEEQLADLRQRLAAVQRILDALPPRCREVFWLFRIEGHSQAEIAQRLGISVNMVERHVMRALLDLRAARELLQ